MPPKKKPAPSSPRHSRSGAESAPIWEDEDGNPGPAPAGARAARRAILGNGVAAVHLDGPSRFRAPLLYLNQAAWRIERPDGSVTILCRHRGAGFRTSGVTVQTDGVVDLSGPGARAGELEELRWPM